MYCSANLYGGIGNQMFQIAACYMFSWKYNYLPIFVRKKYASHGIPIRKLEWDTVLYKCKTVNRLPEGEWLTIHEKYNDPGFKNHEKINIMLDGYFQDLCYFDEKYYGKIRELFEPKDSKKIESLWGKYTSCFSSPIGIHLRSYFEAESDFPPSLPYEYYEKAIKKHFDPDKDNFLIFCDKAKKHLDKILKLCKKTRVAGEKDHEELYLLSKCDNIILANSTFSWWSAFLNKDVKKVIVPDDTWRPGVHPNHLVFMKDWIIE